MIAGNGEAIIHSDEHSRRQMMSRKGDAVMLDDGIVDQYSKLLKAGKPFPEIKPLTEEEERSIADIKPIIRLERQKKD